MHHLYGNAKTVKHGYAIFIAQNSGIDDRPWFAFTLRLISDRINVGRILSPPLSTQATMTLSVSHCTVMRNFVNSDTEVVV